jgi:hypothetical protein
MLRPLVEHRGADLSDEKLATLDGLQLASIAENLRETLGSTRDTTRRGGGGGGSAGVPEWFRGTEADWRRLGETGRRQETLHHLRGGGGGGREILPGVVAGIDIPASEATQVRRALEPFGAYAAQLSQIRDIASRHGGIQARINPEARAEVTPVLTVLRGMVANLGNTGTINAGEVPAINAALPNPGDLEQMTFSSFNTRLESWENIVRGKVDGMLRARGVPDEQLDTAHRVLGLSGGRRAERRPLRPRQSETDDDVRERVRAAIAARRGGQ